MLKSEEPAFLPAPIDEGEEGFGTPRAACMAEGAPATLPLFLTSDTERARAQLSSLRRQIIWPRRHPGEQPFLPSSTRIEAKPLLAQTRRPTLTSSKPESDEEHQGNVVRRKSAAG